MASRRGRKRKNGAKREPSGRVQRPDVDQVRAVALAQRLKVVSVSDARSELAGFPLGILFLKGKISDRSLYDAGVKWAQLHATYAAIMGLPQSTPRASQMNVSYGVPIITEIPDDVIAQRKAQYQAAYRALMDSGSNSCMVVTDICIRDDWSSSALPDFVGNLNRGLRALANHFRIR